jgi:hypothetical protein
MQAKPARLNGWSEIVSESPRWKEIVEANPGRFTHHLELYSKDDVDEELRSWLQDAWTAAG